MIYPPVFEVCSASADLLSLIGSSPVRLYLFGQGVRADGSPPVRPYVVWQQQGGAPENYLGNAPDSDFWTVQFDVYADTADSARSVAMALRNAIEHVAWVESWVGDGVDVATQLRRFTFVTSWRSDRSGD